MSTDLVRDIFDLLFDHEDVPLTYHELYYTLRDQGKLTSTRSSLDSFLDMVGEVPKNYNQVYLVYVYSSGKRQQEPALVFTNRTYAEYLAEVYQNDNGYLKDEDSPSVIDPDHNHYVDFYLSNHQYLPKKFCPTEKNCEFLFCLAGSKNTVAMEKFLDLHPEALYWRNLKGETIMDVAIDHHDNDMQNLIASSLVRDKLNQKEDDLLELQDKIAELQSQLIWRTAEGVIGAVFAGTVGYMLGSMGLF